jgi:hypothetical protein
MIPHGEMAQVGSLPDSFDFAAVSRGQSFEEHLLDWISPTIE